MPCAVSINKQTVTQRNQRQLLCSDMAQLALERYIQSSQTSLDELFLTNALQVTQACMKQALCFIGKGPCCSPQGSCSITHGPYYPLRIQAQ